MTWSGLLPLPFSEARFSLAARSLLMFFLLLLMACGGGQGAGTAAAPPPTDTTPAQVTWLKQNGQPFSTVDPTASDGDLAFLGGLVGDAKYVGLGEATHGTSEFFLMKHRILRYLVEHKGFRAFGIEAQMGRCAPLNRYIQTGEGDPAKLVSDMGFWTWRNSEVLDLVKWMRAYNADPAHVEKLEYFGFDMQDGDTEMNLVLDYLHPIDPQAEETLRAAYAPLRPYMYFANPNAPYYSAASDEVRQQCHQGVVFAYQWMVDHRNAYTTATGVEAYEWALRMALVVTQAESVMAQDAPTSGQAYSRIRDAAMADNAAWFVQQRRPGIKAALWAHNGHINLTQVPAYASYGTPFGGGLRSRLGADYLPMGFLFYQGSALAIPLNADGTYGSLQPNVIPPANQTNSYESVFFATAWPRAMLDLRKIAGSTSTGADWWKANHTTREFGAVWQAGTTFGIETNQLASRFDAVIYIQDSTPAHLYPRPPQASTQDAFRAEQGRPGPRAGFMGH